MTCLLIIQDAGNAADTLSNLLMQVEARSQEIKTDA